MGSRSDLYVNIEKIRSVSCVKCRGCLMVGRSHWVQVSSPDGAGHVKVHQWRLWRHVKVWWSYRNTGHNEENLTLYYMNDFNAFILIFVLIACMNHYKSVIISDIGCHVLKTALHITSVWAGWAKLLLVALGFVTLQKEVYSKWTGAFKIGCLGMGFKC